MSVLGDLEEEIRSASEAVARAERTAASFPQYPSTFVSLKSIEKYRDRLIEQFEAEIKRTRTLACSYRIEFETGRGPIVQGVAAAIGTFQEIYTTVYHALKNGIRQRAKVGQASIDATRLSIAYTYPGSLGFMLTVDEEPHLFFDSPPSVAMENTLSLLSVRDAEDLDQMVEKVGLPAVRLTQRWASDNAKSGFGADIRWTGASDRVLFARLQPAEVVSLSGMLGQYIAKERVLTVGTLQNVDMFERHFVMMIGDRKITGNFERAITALNPAKIPAVYIVELTVASRVASTDQKDTTYFLESLEEFSPSSPLLNDARFLEKI